MSTTVRSLRLEDELWARLGQMAADREMTVNALCAELLSDGAGLDPADPDVVARRGLRAPSARRAAPAPKKDVGVSAKEGPVDVGSIELPTGPAPVAEGGSRGPLDKGVRVGSIELPLGAPTRAPWNRR